MVFPRIIRPGFYFYTLFFFAFRRTRPLPGGWRSVTLTESAEEKWAVCWSTLVMEHEPLLYTLISFVSLEYP
jgi:hypothetical protein